VAAIVLAHAAFLLAPPMLSTDVFNYVDYARIGVVHGLDPYKAVPGDVSQDPIYPWVHRRSTLDAYGPLFTLGSYPLAYLGVAGALWAFKALGAAASLGCVALVWRIAERRGRRGAVAAAIFGLNPLLLVWTVGGAHNDLLMLLATLAGVWWIVSARPALGGAALVMGAAIKATAGVVLPFAFLGARGRRAPVLAGAAVAAAATVLVAYLAFPGHAVGMIDVLRRNNRLISTYDVPASVVQLFGATTLTPRARQLAEIFALVAIAGLALRVWRGGDWIRDSGWAFLALVLSASWLLPWYAVWPLPFAAVTRDRRLLLATLAVQVYVVANEVSLFR
jgi:alpha-1,6-mannosyltransferase